MTIVERHARIIWTRDATLRLYSMGNFKAVIEKQWAIKDGHLFCNYPDSCPKRRARCARLLRRMDKPGSPLLARVYAPEGTARPIEIVKVFSIWSTNLGLYSLHILKINRLKIFKYSFL